MSETTIKAAGYIRVSTEEQKRDGWNLGEDRRLIEERCQREGWELVEIFDDGGRQGDDPDRPGLRALIDRLGDLNVVILRSQDRISRDIGIWAVTSAALRAAGVRVETFSGTIDLESPAGEFMANVMASVGKFEKRQTGARVSQALHARAKAGLHTGGPAPHGYVWEEKKLVIDPVQADIVRQIFSLYCDGVGQRGIVRALEEAGLRTAKGSRFGQSQVSSILSNVFYIAKLRYKDQIIDGDHEPIIDEATFARAEAIRTSNVRQKGGRHPDNGHLLGGGLLRCRCGSAMIARKARRGHERDRYVCSGRIADPASCDQPSIRRELVDEPFLRHVLSNHYDFKAALSRIENEAGSKLKTAQNAVAEAGTKLARGNFDARLSKIERKWQEDFLDDPEYERQRDRVLVEQEEARAILTAARDEAARIEETSVVGDAEQILRHHLDVLHEAVKKGIGDAPHLNAQRNSIRLVFASVELVRSGSMGSGKTEKDGLILHKGPDPVVQDGDQTYWLETRVNYATLSGNFNPTGQLTPVPCVQSYPHGFLWRYCWW